MEQIILFDLYFMIPYFKCVLLWKQWLWGQILLSKKANPNSCIFPLKAACQLCTFIHLFLPILNVYHTEDNRKFQCDARNSLSQIHKSIRYAFPSSMLTIGDFIIVSLLHNMRHCIFSLLQHFPQIFQHLLMGFPPFSRVCNTFIPVFQASTNDSSQIF